MIVISNNLKITADSLDTIASDLNIQPLRQGNILFQGGLVAIDTQGNLNVKGNANFAQNVTVNGQISRRCDCSNSKSRPNSKLQ